MSILRKQSDIQDAYCIFNRKSKIMFKAEIETALPENIIHEVFKHEERKIQQRASYDIEKQGEKTRFVIVAKDSTALRTVLNAIVRLLTVIEKAKEVV